MFVICPDFNNVPFDTQNDTKYANNMQQAKNFATQLAAKYPDNDIYIFRAVKKMRVVGQPKINTYDIDDKGQVLPE